MKNDDGAEEVLSLLSGTLLAMNSIMRERLTPVVKEVLIGYVAADKLDEATAAVLAVVLPPLDDLDTRDLFGE